MSNTIISGFAIGRRSGDGQSLSHKAEGVRTWIENQGAELIHLPSYSPDLNPIERTWANSNSRRTSSKVRTREALEQAVTERLPQISAKEASLVQTSSRHIMTIMILL